MNVLTKVLNALVLNSSSAGSGSGEEEMSIIESLIGIPIDDMYLWIAIGVIVLAAVLMVVWGFVKEVKKK